MARQFGPDAFRLAAFCWTAPQFTRLTEARLDDSTVNPPTHMFEVVRAR